MSEIMLYNIPTLSNNTLKTATETIINELKTQEKAGLKIAFVMACIDKQELYADDGFKSAADYGMKVFGWKKSQAYAYIKAGNKFLDENGVTLLPADGEYTISQLVPLLPLPLDETQTMNEQKEITPSMTIKEIKEAVKKHTKPEEEEPEEDGPEEEEEEPAEIETDKDDPDEMAIIEVSSALSSLAERISENPKNYPMNSLHFVENLIEDFTAFEKTCGFSK